MAKRNDIDTDITLEMNGSKITPTKFRRGVDAFVGLLEAVTKTVCRDDPLVEWRMSVKAGSNLVGALAAEGANLNHVRQILTLVSNGLEQFEIEGEVPPIYPYAAVKSVHDLASITAKKPDDDTSVGIWVKKQRREITPKIKQAAKAAIGSGFQEEGTIEGKLSALSERGSVHFVVYEQVWDRRVKCSVPKELVEAVTKMWRKRVAVHGLVYYRGDGLPTRINAVSVETLPNDSDLPSHDDVLGIQRENA